ncbi:MAG: ribonuclease P protein component [Bacteroidales bacterium]|nr:ribonuclease P protein component [Bacteroidales bacterium]
MKPLGLSSDERIKSRKLIERLYAEGRKLYVFPFAVCWLACDEAEAQRGARLMVSVSKRRFKHAVDRNRAKRIMRECYRLAKPALYDALASSNTHLLIAISYSHNQLLDYHRLQASYTKLQQKLIERINEEN